MLAWCLHGFADCSLLLTVPLGITAYELAIGEPPHAHLPSMCAAIRIPMSPPPTLPESEHFCAHFHSFLAAALTKDFNQRPSAEELLRHPFIVHAPGPEALAANVAMARSELESRHEAVDEMALLMGQSCANGGGGVGRSRASRSTAGMSDSMCESCSRIDGSFSVLSSSDGSTVSTDELQAHFNKDDDREAIGGLRVQEDEEEAWHF